MLGFRPELGFGLVGDRVGHEDAGFFDPIVIGSELLRLEARLSLEGLRKDRADDEASTL